MNENIKKAIELLEKESKNCMVIFNDGNKTTYHQNCKTFDDLQMLTMVSIQPIVDFMKDINVDNERIKMYFKVFVEACVDEIEENQEVN